MKLKIETQTAALPREGEVEATVKATKEKSETKCIIEFAFVQDGKDFTAVKEYEKKLNLKSELFRDAQTILARPFNEVEENTEFDITTLNGQQCRVVVVHKRTSGGKTSAVVTTVLRKANR